MINHFAHVSLYKELGEIKRSEETKKSFVLSYPCGDKYKCTPYVLDLNEGVYKFECWGSSATRWGNDGSHSTPGLGGYTSGILYVHHPTTFYVYVGGQGIFNAMKNIDDQIGLSTKPGGATDVRINASENWWDTKSLISRIMVAAGGGAAEWTSSYGGHAGGINGGQSHYWPVDCDGATQISGSDCDSNSNLGVTYSAVKGTFGSAGFIEPINGDDYGAIGGGGYYGGTSYHYSFAGSGGSSFISGYEGCNAVKNQETIEHTGHPNHYSGLIFSNSEMIPGNSSMPLPTSLTQRDIYSGSGAFRLTLIHYQYHCTHKQTVFGRTPLFLFILVK